MPQVFFHWWQHRHWELCFSLVEGRCYSDPQSRRELELGRSFNSLPQKWIRAVPDVEHFVKEKHSVSQKMLSLLCTFMPKFRYVLKEMPQRKRLIFTFPGKLNYNLLVLISWATQRRSVGGKSWYDTCDGMYVSRNLSLYIGYSAKYYITPHTYQEKIFQNCPEVCFVKLYIFFGERKFKIPDLESCS